MLNDLSDFIILNIFALAVFSLYLSIPKVQSLNEKYEDSLDKINGYNFVAFGSFYNLHA
jgi:hypothetical protein